jgi:hypothetical protein
MLFLINLEQRRMCASRLTDPTPDSFSHPLHPVWKLPHEGLGKPGGKRPPPQRTVEKLSRVKAFSPEGTVLDTLADEVHGGLW